MVAFVKTRSLSSKRGIPTKYIGTEEEKQGDGAIEQEGKNWEAQLALENELEDTVFASVAKGNSVNVFSVSKAQSAPTFLQKTINTKTWGVKFTVGTITDGGDAAGKGKIEWNSKDVPDIFVKDIQENLLKVDPFGVTGFLTENGTLVFVVWGRNTDGKYVFVVAHLKNTNNH